MRNWIKLLIFATMLPWPGDADEYGFDAGKDAFVSENYATAVAIWREQASAGDADAQLAMGLVCRRGSAFQRQPQKPLNGWASLPPKSCRKRNPFYGKCSRSVTV